MLWTVHGSVSTSDTTAVTPTLVRRCSTTSSSHGRSVAQCAASSRAGPPWCRTCATAADNRSYVDRFDLEVTHLANGDATFQSNYTASLTCTLSGTLEQHGQQYRIPTATYKCSDGVDTLATMYEIKATALGIEGRISAASAAGGCREDANFAAVLH